jgi:hypothetical protein
MTHREIQTASLFMESAFHNGGALSFQRAMRIEVSPSISSLPGKDTQTYAGIDLSRTRFRPSPETYPITHASMPRDRFHQVCNPDSIPI